AASFACSVYLPMTPPKVASNLRGSYQHGVVFSAKSLDHPERAFKEAARLYEMGALDLRIEQTFSLGEVANAQAISAAGRVTGKLVITLA
ncbi:zinc-binding dehydrogenase, partial [Pseudomonas syringae group sp. J248-6]|uniref:zinc-binding dehydrogenase n=1 Tax=Pseudomonas syringae group sp. J248-6 TaxID=3079590 RepID=UPI0029125F48